MKKIIFILSGILLSGIGFYGCKKGENDPMLSLHTRKARLVGEWHISSGQITANNSGTPYSETWTENTVSINDDGTIYSGTSAKYIITIEKDGTYKLENGATVTVSSIPFVYSHTESGTWNWLGGVGDVKNKSHIVLNTLSYTDVNGSSTSTGTYTGDSAPSKVMYIDQLKNKEIIIKWDGTSVSGTNTNSETGTMTFTLAK